MGRPQDPPIVPTVILPAATPPWAPSLQWSPHHGTPCGTHAPRVAASARVRSGTAHEAGVNPADLCTRGLRTPDTPRELYIENVGTEGSDQIDLKITNVTVNGTELNRTH